LLSTKRDLLLIRFIILNITERWRYISGKNKKRNDIEQFWGGNLSKMKRTRNCGKEREQLKKECKERLAKDLLQVQPFTG
jgi:hypothetical protein